MILFCRIKNLSTRYRENLELVLKDISINIQSGEKVFQFERQSLFEMDSSFFFCRLELLDEQVAEKVVYVLHYFVLSNRPMVKLSSTM